MLDPIMQTKWSDQRMCYCWVHLGTSVISNRIAIYVLKIFWLINDLDEKKEGIIAIDLLQNFVNNTIQVYRLRWLDNS